MIDGTDTGRLPEAVDPTGIVVVLFDAGPLFPSEKGHEEDRNADLSDYVYAPRHLGLLADLITVDRRMRRRCLLEGAQLVEETDGYVLLHDAVRKHYQCVWESYRSGRRVGGQLWIGAQHDTDFSDVLPESAFEL